MTIINGLERDAMYNAWKVGCFPMLTFTCRFCPSGVVFWSCQFILISKFNIKVTFPLSILCNHETVDRLKTACRLLSKNVLDSEFDRLRWQHTMKPDGISIGAGAGVNERMSVSVGCVLCRRAGLNRDEMHVMCHGERDVREPPVRRRRPRNGHWFAVHHYVWDVLSSGDDR